LIINEYLSNNDNQNLDHYLSCQVVSRTAYLNFCYGCICLKALASGPIALASKVQALALKGHSGAELHIYFLVHLESIYYEIFFYSKIVPNCAVAK